MPTIQVLHRAAAFVFAVFVLPGFAANICYAQYGGSGANAAWRAVAEQMIDQNRKADLDVTVQTADGNPVEGAEVSIEMTRHEFPFGSAVDPRYFLPSRTEFDAQYAAHVESLFNVATLENHLKWRAWSGHWGAGFAQSVTLDGLDWLAARQIPVRGHAMMWPRYQSVPDSVRALLDLPAPTQQELQAIYDASFDHISDIGLAIESKVYCWDMLNEPRTSFDIEDKLIGFTPNGETMITSRADLRERWFSAAQQTDPSAQMFLNDFAVIAGGDDLTNSIRNNYRDNLNAMLLAGAPIDALGFQSHFNDAGRPLTGIENVWILLDEFSSNGFPVHITEFTYETLDKPLQAAYTKDFMTACFAHPSVEAFVFWGFWEGKINKVEAALFDLNFNPNLNGQAYLDLVFDQWWTSDNGMSAPDGSFNTRGFKGSYRIKVTYQGLHYYFDTVLESGGSSFLATIPDPIEVVPETLQVTRGNSVAGGIDEIALSDNQDLSISRSNQDVNSRTEFEIKSTLPVSNPQTVELLVETSVFARSNVVHSVWLFNYDDGEFELVDSRNASRFGDSTIQILPAGDLARFIESGTGCVEARVRFQSDSQRQRFSSNTDRAVWLIVE
ncbi:MAG: endo-1,4-beta-xylanase [Planctomycetota bacterium]